MEPVKNVRCTNINGCVFDVSYGLRKHLNYWVKIKTNSTGNVLEPCMLSMGKGCCKVEIVYRDIRFCGLG
jgi:hypothetical protein